MKNVHTRTLEMGLLSKPEYPIVPGPFTCFGIKWNASLNRIKFPTQTHILFYSNFDS